MASRLGKIPTTSVRRRISRSSRSFNRVIRPDLSPEFFGEHGEGEDVGTGGIEVGERFRQFVFQRVEDPVELGVDRLGIGLVIDVSAAVFSPTALAGFCSTSSKNRKLDPNQTRPLDFAASSISGSRHPSPPNATNFERVIMNYSQMFVEEGGNHLVHHTDEAGFTWERIFGVFGGSGEVCSAYPEWVLRDPVNAWMSVIPGAIIGQPMDIKLISDEPAAYVLPVSRLRTDAAIANASDYADYLSAFNDFGFMVSIVSHGAGCATIEVFDASGARVGYLGEEYHIHPTAMGGVEDQRVRLDNLLTKAVFVYEHGKSFVEAVLQAAEWQFLDDYEASGNMALDPWVIAHLGSSAAPVL
jgi:hypothetical protein